MVKILLVGSEGQVGRELQPILSSACEVLAWSRQHLDLADLEQTYQAVVAAKPDWVVNAAAYTAVDQAEQESDLAHRINGQAPGVLAQAAADCQAALLHLSTDYVFDGTQGSPYTEADAPRPMSAYGESKLMGEQAVRSHLANSIILRTAWVYGAQGQRNFVKTMLRLGADRPLLKVVSDQVGSPTWAKDIAIAISQLVQYPAAEVAGTYHFTNSGVASWYDFAIAIFEEAVHLGLLPNAPTVLPITTVDYPTPAKRPANSVLSCVKIAGILGQSPPYWRDSLRQMLSELVS